jgi:topoisomerase-4 subunit A
MGKDIVLAGIFKKADERLVYHCIYLDAKSGRSMAKRFQVFSITRDKEYDLTTGHSGNKILYFSANPNGENEIVNVKLTSGAKARTKIFDFDFSTLEIKGRNAKGNILTKYPVRKVEFVEKGASTLGGLEIWFDDVTGRLNRDERGKLLGEFSGDEQILVLYKDGSYELTTFELTNRYDPNKLCGLYKFDAKKSVNAIHYDGDSKNNYVKRFQIETSTNNKIFSYISEAKGSKLQWVGYGNESKVLVTIKMGSKGVEKKEIDLEEIIDVKGWKANGNKFPFEKFHKLELIASEEEVKQKEEKAEPIEVDTEEEEPVKELKSAEEVKPEEKPKLKNEEQSKDKEEVKPKAESKNEQDSEDLKPGTSIELDIKPKDDKSQLGMFESE